jgi:hypothetical protein
MWEADRRNVGQQGGVAANQYELLLDWFQFAPMGR